MSEILHTERLILHEISTEHISDLFEMDSNPNVHLYIENKPLQNISEMGPIIQMIQTQYRENGVGRWAVLLKETGECIGWAGLKLYKELVNGEMNFIDLGYRFKEKYWNKGYATESSKGVIEHAQKKLGLKKLFAHADVRNNGSINVLLKCGFELKNNFILDGREISWFELELK